MNNQIPPNEIFFELQSSMHAGEEASFLDIAEMFGESFNEPRFQPFFMEQSPQIHEQLFQVIPQREQTCMSCVSQVEKPVLTQKPQKQAYKSSYNKNVCINICQKTIKVIKKGTFQEKVAQFCSMEKVDEEKFKIEMNKRKGQFSGPKALSRYVEENKAENRVFIGFMKWFLSQKYLRIALNEGEMKDVKAYIEYKNNIILPLLQ